MYKAPKTGQLGLFDGSSWQSAANSIGVLEVYYEGNDWDSAIERELDRLSNYPRLIIAIPKRMKI